MVKIIAGILMFILIILLLVGVIPMNLWSIGAVFLCLIVLWKG